MEMLTPLQPEREVCLYFLKDINKFPQSNLFQEKYIFLKIQLFIFFPLLVENIGF